MNEVIFVEEMFLEDDRVDKIKDNFDRMQKLLSENTDFFDRARQFADTLNDQGLQNLWEHSGQLCSCVENVLWMMSLPPEQWHVKNKENRGESEKMTDNIAIGSSAVTEEEMVLKARNVIHEIFKDSCEITYLSFCQTMFEEAVQHVIKDEQFRKNYVKQHLQRIEEWGSKEGVKH